MPVERLFIKNDVQYFRKVGAHFIEFNTCLRNGDIYDLSTTKLNRDISDPLILKANVNETFEFKLVVPLQICSYPKRYPYNFF